MHSYRSYLAILLFIYIANTSAWAIAGLSDGLNFDAFFASSPTPFVIHVDEDFVDVTKQKVGLYRPARNLKKLAAFEDGAPQENITAIRDYWVEQYSWDHVQTDLNNRFKHFTTTVNAKANYTHPIPLHFVHHKSNRSDAIPLLMLHGWPSSFTEWSSVIGPLTNPPNGSTPAFHVVAPSLPGFGFSPAPEYPGCGAREQGQGFDELMHQLNYTKYAIATTDLGTFAGLWMLHDFPDTVTAHFTDFYFTEPNATDLARYAAKTTTPEENTFIESYNTLTTNDSGYSYIHQTRPLSIAIGMTDSPVGFVAWIWQLMHTISDGYPYTAEQLITDSMMLSIQGPYGGMRAYKEFFREGGINASAYPLSTQPTGISQWPSLTGNIVPFSDLPLEWIQRTANVTFYNNQHPGGHFPAISNPNAWLRDIRAFFATLA
ncbi:MAG: hypothetical protein M1818_006331 [Claussenomyces sp. TS43310]|nr:MAG: hypothetical protein M1818_006331 [Claussenomyces sp. TS43310]